MFIIYRNNTIIQLIILHLKILHSNFVIEAAIRRAKA